MKISFASKTILVTALAMSALNFAGCDAYWGGHVHHDHGYSEERPRYVEAQPVYVEQQPTYVVVLQAPPPVIVERRPPAPTQAHVWIEGSWNWDGNSFAWQGGRYQVPPEPEAVWVSARYVNSPDGYHYTPGRWTHSTNRNDHGNGKGHGN